MRIVNNREVDRSNSQHQREIVPNDVPTERQSALSHKIEAFTAYFLVHIIRFVLRIVKLVKLQAC